MTNKKALVKIPTEQRHTGTNNGSETTSKSSRLIVATCKVVQFHFIGVLKKCQIKFKKVQLRLFRLKAQIRRQLRLIQQRVVKIQYHLQNMGNSAIIIGQELIECKKRSWTRQLGKLA